VLYPIQQVAEKLGLNPYRIFVFKNTRDSSQITHLGNQAYRSRLKIAQQVFADVALDPTVSCYLTWSRAHLRNFLFALKSFQARTGWFTLPRSGGNVCPFATWSPNAQSSLQSSPKLTRDIMKTADNDLILWIYECCNNLLRENISVSSLQKSQPKRHKKAFRNVAKKKVSLKRKRKIIQIGGLLAPLLSAVVPAILSLPGVWIAYKKWLLSNQECLKSLRKGSMNNTR